PHTPLQVPEEYYNIYRDMDPSSGFVNDTRPFPVMTEKDKEDARRVYAMVTNIDDNVGRLLNRLEELEISEKTIVIFMTDNGPQQRRYNAGMRGLKSSVYRGGVRVPFWIRYPGSKRTGIDIETTAANIDLFPTLADICNAKIPEGLKIDGISLTPLIREDQQDKDARSLFFYWTRHSPELYTNIALLKGRYKLVGNGDYNASVDKFELFDIEQDPYEQDNILNDNPERAAGLKKELDLIFYELAGSENLLDRPRIETGTMHENPVILNRNDADGQWGIWEQSEIFGFWRVLINEGLYNLRFKFIEPVPSGGKMMVETGTFINQMKNDKGDTDFLEMKDIKLPSMRCDFVPFYLSGTRRIFPLWVEIERIDI
ncbi:MAG TPA: sulfatase-like hydrolase/transferase, partial [Bacteroidales bacterium]|nr:sulfatase-like hydrolase/transferase [Bacteroidales bacterium]